MDARAEFDGVAKKLSTYISRHCPPGSVAGAGAQEASALLGELVLLDQSIVQNCNSASASHTARFESAIQKAVQQNPSSEFAQLIAARTKLVQSAVGYESPTLFPEESQAVLTRLQSDTAAFYRTAHRLLKVLQGLPCLKKVHCKQIAIVRNQLLEHAGEGSNNRGRWSFGFATGVGPRVRALTFVGEAPSHSDDGYIPNRDAFLSALRVCLDSTA